MNNKAWVGAIVGGVSAALGVASGMDFTHFDPNAVRDLVLAVLGGGVAGFSGVWYTPNKTQATKQ